MSILSRRRLRLLSTIAGVLAGLGPLALSAATFTASLDRNPITLGESATLSLTFNGGTPANDPALPQIPNLQVSYIGPSSQFSVINGQVSSSVTYNYTLVPQQAGEFRIPPVTSAVGGQAFATQPLKLLVLKPGTPAPGVGGSDLQPAFMKLAVPKQQMYLGETLAVELELFLSDKVQNFGNFHLTGLHADGFTVRGSRGEGPRRRVQVGNSTYTEIPFRLALTPIKTGSLTVGPISASLVVELPSAQRRRDPFWDPFGVMGSSEQREIAVATDSEKLQVVPLPAQGAPPGFSGAVGNYTLSVSAGPTNVAVGDPITVKVQIAGNGELDSLSLPDQPAWRNFKTYPSAPKVDTTDSLGTRGTKTFEEVVVPQTADIKELPPVTFSYFDVEKGSYETLSGPAIPLAVRPGGAASVPVVAAANPGAQDNPPPAQDIVSIKQYPGELLEIRPILPNRGWFLALQGVPAIALLGSVIWRKRSDRLVNNPKLRRRRQVAQRLREGRGELRRFAAENDSEQFFATLFRLLQEQLGERLDLPASAITEAVLEERLQPVGVPEQTLAGLRELFQRCNLQRYAPIRSSQELSALIPKAEAVLGELQEVNA